MRSYSFQKRKGNLVLFIILFFIVAGYLFFFSSTSWMPASLSAELQSPLQSDITWAKRIIQIRRWDYCPNNKTMEVELDITNKAYDGIDNYNIAAATRSKANHNVKAIIEERDWLIIQIYDVPSNFGEVSLRLSADIQDVEILKLYSNENIIRKVDNISVLDRQGYRKMRLDMDIQRYNDSILSLEKDIELLEERNERMQTQMQELKENTDFLTSDQLEKLNSQVTEMQSTINSTNETIQDKLEEINENSERIELLKKQQELEETKGGELQ